jgi:hypothetical protein
MMQEGSGATMGERTGRVARKGARETKRFFGGLAKGWKEEGTGAQPAASPQPYPQPYQQPPQPTYRPSGYGNRGY